MFVDSHAHLEMAEFDQDRDEVIKRATDSGLRFIVTVGTAIADCHKAIDLAGQYPMVYAAVGIHPHNAKTVQGDTYDVIMGLARRDKVVAYGEIGLDFFHNLSPRQDQMRRFGEQLEVAHDLGLPVIIHSREAQREVAETLYSWRGRLRGIIHCFSGDRHMAKKYLDLGYYISVPGVVTFPQAVGLREVVRTAPLESILLETDCPYLAPQPYRGKRNEPSYVTYMAQAIAEILALSPEAVGETTSRNAADIFQIPLA